MFLRHFNKGGGGDFHLLFFASLKGQVKPFLEMQIHLTRS